jgi:rubrerythrin
MAAEITLEEHYAELAKRFRAMASAETGQRKTEFEHLAECYEHAVLDHDKAETLAE